MKKIVIMAAFLLMATGFVNAQEQVENHDEGAIAKVGDMAPDFKVEMLDGSTVSLGDFSGKIVVLTFWATWCPYCVQEMDVVQEKLIDHYNGNDVVFLPVSRGEKRDVVEKFVEKKGYKFSTGLDPEQKIWGMYASKSIPRNFIIDRQGRIAESLIGYSPEDFEVLLESVDKLLNM